MIFIFRKQLFFCHFYLIYFTSVSELLQFALNIANCCAVISYSKYIHSLFHIYRYCTEVQSENVFLTNDAGTRTHFGIICFRGHVGKHMQIIAFYQQHIQGHIWSTTKTIQNLLYYRMNKSRILDISIYSKKMKVKVSQFMPWRHLWGVEL